MLAVSALVVAAGGAVWANTDGLGTTAGSVSGASESATSDPATSDPVRSHRPGPESRGSDRSRLQGATAPPSAPTVTVTLSGRVVNGRLQPEPVDPPQSGAGSYLVASGGAAPPDRAGDVLRYLVEVEDGLPFDPGEFAADVHAILTDERGWGRRFERVDEGPVDFRVSLASPDLTDEQCHPLRTFGEVSCWNGYRAVINAKRWGTGADTYGADILSYREYLINHEVGHALGHDHVGCPGEGELAPVMLQQTRSLDGCEPNPWPSP